MMYSDVTQTCKLNKEDMERDSLCKQFDIYRFR